jgi:mannose-6-phosphate isomerase
MLYPLTFQPRFKERLWGGRTLADLYQKQLPANLPIGESWELCDRSGDVSVVDAGPLAGRDLHWLMELHAQEILGPVPLQEGRFPLLVKILDARQKLSLQVHPPASRAAELHGQPKTEVWFISNADPGAELYAGLRRGVTRQVFEERLKTGTVAECFHRVAVRRGDAMFMPSGRVHGIGAGCVIFEIQQNSDTTYRVFDWNRVDRDGQARELHIPESLVCIDFGDFEPSLVQEPFAGPPEAQARRLVSCPYFQAEHRRWTSGVEERFGGRPLIIATTAGDLQIVHRGLEQKLRAGRLCLLPASLERVIVRARSSAEFLIVEAK